MDMTSDEAGRSSNHPHCTNLPRSSLSEDIVWGVDHAASNNPYISLHHADNHRWSNNQQVHHNIRNLAPYGTGIVNASTNSIAATSSTANAVNSKSARWIQPSSRRRVNQHRPPPPHSEHDVVRHSLDDANASIIIRLGKPSIVNTIRMQLWDRDLRSYSYSVDVSLDRSTWHRIVDYRNYMCRSWQTLHFPSRVIHFIRITGTRNTFNRTFHIITFRCLYSENVFQQIDCFMVPNYNVANIDHGAIVLEGVSRNRDALIDGNIRMYDWNSGYTCHQLGNGAIVVQLAQPFLLRSMRFLLWDLDPRTYSYSVYVSNDRLDWKLVRDASQEQCRSWQTITFPLQLVTFIRVVGTYNTANDVFHLVHLECPYPPAETTESDTEAHGEKLLGLTTSVMPEPNNDRGNIVIPLSSRVNQHDSSNDNVGSDEYQSRNSHQSPVIGEITQDRVLRDSDSIRSESSVHDTNDQSNVFRMHYNQRPNTMTTTIADYDLMSDLNTSSPSTTADGGNIALTASTIAVSSTPATTISDQHGMAPVGQDSLPHYSFHHA
ncbi:unnamed protein product [Heterobilharzia americana]|nr:unnamed protein product [Heterobilharzia americana]